MSEHNDPYRILEVSPTADTETIRAAYRRLARQAHPDLNPTVDAEAQMRQINWAYDLLTNPRRRSRYDREQSFAHPTTTAGKPASPATHSSISDTKSRTLILIGLVIWAALSLVNNLTRLQQSPTQLDLQPPWEIISRENLESLAIQSDLAVSDITNLVWSPERQAMAILSSSGDTSTLRLLLLPDLEQLWQTNILSSEALAFSPDGRSLAITPQGTTSLILYDVESGQIISQETSSQCSGGNMVVFSTDGEHIYTAQSRQSQKPDQAVILIYKWQAQSLQCLRQVAVIPGQLIGFAAGPGDSGLAQIRGDSGTEIVTWDLAAFEELCHIPGFLAGMVQADGAWSAFTTSEERLEQWDAVSCSQLEVFSGIPVPGTAAISPDGQLLVTATEALEFWDIASGELLRQSQLDPEIYGNLMDLSFSPNGRWLAGISSNRLSVWAVPVIPETP